ncbi:GTPase [Streptomyces boninensis]|uniref:GTPase n=1 Tax=Streptomyces boninensis TaxID=2039455 RepID=UPI003B21B1F7
MPGERIPGVVGSGGVRTEEAPAGGGEVPAEGGLGGLVGPAGPAGPAGTDGLVGPDAPGSWGAEEVSPARVADGAPRHGVGPLRGRLDALRELVGLSRTRLDTRTLAEAGRVLDEAADRQKLSLEHTVVAIAGATGSGKSSLFNALAGATLSETGTRRPTTGAPSACAWRGQGDDAPLQLLERLGMPPRAARPQRDDLGLRGLVLVDLPDFDSMLADHRAQVERVLGRVDAVIWVVDPEKYADAVLHDRYLKPLAGYAEVTFVVLNQIDRLPDSATDQVLDDLRRLLDDDGMALGEHGEPGSCVLGLSAATGEGVGELRSELASFITERGAAARRLTADVDGAVARLREVYVGEGQAAGLSGAAREDFEDRLAEAVGARAAGQAAEREWLREAQDACDSCWTQLGRWYRERWGREADAEEPSAEGWGKVLRKLPGQQVPAMVDAVEAGAGALKARAGGWSEGGGRSASGARSGSGRAGAGWAAAARTGGGAAEAGSVPAVASRPVVEQAVRTVAAEAGAGLPGPWAQAVQEAAVRGSEGLAEALEDAVREVDAVVTPDAAGKAGGGGKASGGGKEDAAGTGRMPRPRWWSVIGATQNALFMLQMLCVLWLFASLVGAAHLEWPMLVGFALVCAGGGPLLSVLCRLAARAPARRYGQEAERRLRGATAKCGRARVLEPIAAELLRYREVREQYVVAAGGAEQL